jgi:hypothetical protein
MTDPKQTIFRTLTLGESKDSLEEKLKDYHVSSWARELFDKMPIGPKKEIQLVVVTPRDLGLDTSTLKEIYAAAKAQGYELCPPEVGPLLRVNYPDQPRGEWLIVGMEPIADSDGDLSVFSVEHDGDARWLRGSYGSPDGVWDAGSRFLFALSSPLASDTKSSSVPLPLKKKKETTAQALTRIADALEALAISKGVIIK